MTTVKDPYVALPSVRDEAKRRHLQWIVASGFLALVTLFAVRYAIRTAPTYASWALLVFFAIVVAAAMRPITSLYTIVFFSLMTDKGTVDWFPFNKNLSSRESLLFIYDPFTISPLEIVIAVAFLSWLIGIIGEPGARIIKAPVFRPMAFFSVFVVFGFLYGVSRGGDLRIALFEGRALFILFPVYVLATNLCGPRELRRLTVVALVAIVIQCLFALRFLYRLPPAVRYEMEDLGEHGAAMHMNVIFVITFTLYLYRGATRGARFLLLLSVIPVGMAYLAAQRRAGVIALGVGLAFVVLTLWWRHRIKFFAVAPIMLIVVSGYTAAFWNNQSDAGFPAQAIKTVIAPDSASEKDRSSDEYRKAENFDINFTIKAAPVLGLGFGQAFYRPIPLPDISFFEFYQYIPHNSILWIWIKTGVFGFLSMMVMFAVAIRAGVATLVKERDPTAAALAIVGITYIAMFAVFAFVDIAWDSRNMVFLALAMALCSPSSVSSPAQPRGRPAEVNKEPVAALR